MLPVTLRLHRTIRWSLLRIDSRWNVAGITRGLKLCAAGAADDRLDSAVAPVSNPAAEASALRPAALQLLRCGWVGCGAARCRGDFPAFSWVLPKTIIRIPHSIPRGQGLF